MYLLISHIPVYTNGSQTLVDISWQRDILLARDWLARPFGGLTLLAPSKSLSSADGSQLQLEPIGGDGVTVVPSFDLDCRARRFWLTERSRWMADLRRLLPYASVTHCSASDVYKPMWYLAQQTAARSGVATVLVGPDMDPHLTVDRGFRGRLFCGVFDRLMRRAGGTADLTLLKEGAVADRYSSSATNPQTFCHSMHRRADVISQERLTQRLRSLSEPRPLRAVFAGRFVARKGVSQAIRAVAAARARGVMLEYHLYGSGPMEAELRREVEAVGVKDHVVFHGVVEYSDTFLRRLREYDLMLFLPTEEDTPRMIYDGMAAGLPFVGTRIPFLQHRVAKDGCGVLVDSGNCEHAGAALQRLATNLTLMQDLSCHAAIAGREHAVENWYQRRVDWTCEAVARRRIDPHDAAGCSGKTVR